MGDDPTNYGRYTTEFQRLHAEEMNTWTGPGLPPPRDKNSAGRYAFWGVPGRTLDTVMAHIVARGPSLFAPSPSDPLGAEEHRLAVVFLTPNLEVKEEVRTPPRRGGGNLVIRDGSARGNRPLPPPTKLESLIAAEEALFDTRMSAPCCRSR